MLHGLGLHGADYMFNYMGMKWYLIELCLYGLGTLIFCSKSLVPLYAAVTCELIVESDTTTRALCCRQI